VRILDIDTRILFVSQNLADKKTPDETSLALEGKDFGIFWEKRTNYTVSLKIPNRKKPHTQKSGGFLE